MDIRNTTQDRKRKQMSSYPTSNNYLQGEYENTAYKYSGDRYRSTSAPSYHQKTISGFQSSVPGPIMFSERTYAERQDEKRRKMEEEAYTTTLTTTDDYMYMSTRVRSPSPDKYSPAEKNFSTKHTIGHCHNWRTVTNGMF